MSTYTDNRHRYNRSQRNRPPPRNQSRQRRDGPPQQRNQFEEIPNAYPQSLLNLPNGYPIQHALSDTPPVPSTVHEFYICNTNWHSDSQSDVLPPPSSADSSSSPSHGFVYLDDLPSTPLSPSTIPILNRNDPTWESILTSSSPPLVVIDRTVTYPRFVLPPITDSTLTGLDLAEHLFRDEYTTSSDPIYSLDWSSVTASNIYDFIDVHRDTLLLPVTASTYYFTRLPPRDSPGIDGSDYQIDRALNVYLNHGFPSDIDDHLSLRVTTNSDTYDGSHLHLSLLSAFQRVRHGFPIGLHLLDHITIDLDGTIVDATSFDDSTAETIRYEYISFLDELRKPSSSIALRYGHTGATILTSIDAYISRSTSVTSTNLTERLTSALDDDDLFYDILSSVILRTRVSVPVLLDGRIDDRIVFRTERRSRAPVVRLNDVTSNSLADASTHPQFVDFMSAITSRPQYFPIVILNAHNRPLCCCVFSRYQPAPDGLIPRSVLKFPNQNIHELFWHAAISRSFSFTIDQLHTYCMQFWLARDYDSIRAIINTFIAIRHVINMRIYNNMTYEKAINKIPAIRYDILDAIASIDVITHTQPINETFTYPLPDNMIEDNRRWYLIIRALLPNPNCECNPYRWELTVPELSVIFAIRSELDVAMIVNESTRDDIFATFPKRDIIASLTNTKKINAIRMAMNRARSIATILAENITWVTIDKVRSVINGINGEPFTDKSIPMSERIDVTDMKVPMMTSFENARTMATTIDRLVRVFDYDTMVKCVDVNELKDQCEGDVIAPFNDKVYSIWLYATADPLLMVHLAHPVTPVADTPSEQSRLVWTPSTPSYTPFATYVNDHFDVSLDDIQTVMTSMMTVSDEDVKGLINRLTSSETYKRALSVFHSALSVTDAADLELYAHCPMVSMMRFMFPLTAALRGTHKWIASRASTDYRKRITGLAEFDRYMHASTVAFGIFPYNYYHFQLDAPVLTRNWFGIPSTVHIKAPQTDASRDDTILVTTIGPLLLKRYHRSISSEIVAEYVGSTVNASETIVTMILNKATTTRRQTMLLSFIQRCATTDATTLRNREIIGCLQRAFRGLESMKIDNGVVSCFSPGPYGVLLTLLDEDAIGYEDLEPLMAESFHATSTMQGYFFRLFDVMTRESSFKIVMEELKDMLTSPLCMEEVRNRGGVYKRIVLDALYSKSYPFEPRYARTSMCTSSRTWWLALMLFADVVATKAWSRNSNESGELLWGHKDVMSKWIAMGLVKKDTAMYYDCNDAEIANVKLRVNRSRWLRKLWPKKYDEMVTMVREIGEMVSSPREITQMSDLASLLFMLWNVLPTMSVEGEEDEVRLSIPVMDVRRDLIPRDVRYSRWMLDDEDVLKDLTDEMCAKAG